MLVEINETSAVGIVVKDKKGFRVVPIEEYMKNQIDTIKSNATKVESLESYRAEQEKSNVPGRLVKLEKAFKEDKVKATLVRFMAFEILNDDINYNGKDYPADYEQVKEWVFKPNGDAPETLKPYIKTAMGEDDEEETEEIVND